MAGVYITLNTTPDKRKHFYSEPEDQSRGEGEFKTLEGGAPRDMVRKLMNQDFKNMFGLHNLCILVPSIV